jgi:hypothetical protein
MQKPRNTKTSKIRKKIDDDLLRDFHSVSRGARDQLSKPAREYLDAIISPETAKTCGIPTLLGGEPGKTGKIRLKSEGTLVVGTAGVGFLCLGGIRDGFYQDRSIALVTTSAYAAGTVPTTSATVGVEPMNLVQSPYSTTVINNDSDAVSYRVVGMSAEIIPIGSALSQDGDMCLLEAQNQTSLGGLSYESLASYNNARVISAIKFGEQKDKIVLNVHPKERPVDNVAVDPVNPFVFRTSGVSNNSPAVISSPAVIAVSAASGLKFRVRIFIIYEYRGSKVKNPYATMTDSRGMNLALNTFRMKKISGWVGQQHHVVEGYNHALVKARHEDNPDSKKWSELWSSAKKLWFFAKDVAGF